MTAGSASATSIRRRLLLFLLPPLTLLMLVGVFINYRTATLFVRAAYDQKLADMARSFATQIQQGKPSAERCTTGDPVFHLDTGRTDPCGTAGPARSCVGQRTSDLWQCQPEWPRPSSRDLSHSRGRSSQSLKNDASRPNPGRFILASNWLIDFIQLDITLLIVWIGVHFGLKPLLALRRQIEARSARELSPLDTRRFRPKCGR